MESYEKYKIIVANCFSANVRFVTKETALSFIVKNIPYETAISMTNDEFIEKCFDKLFEDNSADIISSKHDMFIDDDMPDLEDDAYCDLHSSYMIDIQNSLKNLV
jgi:hypothetical protein